MSSATFSPVYPVFCDHLHTSGLHLHNGVTSVVRLSFGEFHLYHQIYSTST